MQWSFFGCFSFCISVSVCAKRNFIGRSPHHCEAHHLHQRCNLVHLCRLSRQWGWAKAQMMLPWRANDVSAYKFAKRTWAQMKKSKSFDLDFLAGAGGFEPATHGFGDRYSTSWAIPLYCAARCHTADIITHLFPNIQSKTSDRKDLNPRQGFKFFWFFASDTNCLQIIRYKISPSLLQKDPNPRNLEKHNFQKQSIVQSEGFEPTNTKYWPAEDKEKATANRGIFFQVKLSDKLEFTLSAFRLLLPWWKQKTHSFPYCSHR